MRWGLVDVITQAEFLTARLTDALYFLSTLSDDLMRVHNSIADYYCCPQDYCHVVRDAAPSSEGFFNFGPAAVCYGHCCGPHATTTPSNDLYDVLPEASWNDGKIHLPFNLDEIIDNLRCELYVDQRNSGSFLYVSNAYYFMRPVLPVAFRRHLQKFHLRRRDQLRFPQWPIDSSVDNIFETLMLLSVRATKTGCIPFIWFWPDAKAGCAIMTHDVESAKGRDFCSTLMDIDDAYSIKSSFQIIPENRYRVSEEFLKSIRLRGFEIAVHDLNHDGHLFRNRTQFLERAAKINEYLKKFQTEGFRAGALYRRQLWYDALKCSYDMSVPNAARFDPQSGGCCTVMPYFVGDVLEIPVTTTQDYTLFHILNDYSMDLWNRQTERIMEKHGLISFIVHPDYITRGRARSSYESLLGYLNNLRQTRGVWITTPGAVNRWWRQRAAMTLAQVGGKWEIQGEGSEHARVAYASEVDGKLAYTIAGSSPERLAKNEGPGVLLPHCTCTTK